MPKAEEEVWNEFHDNPEALALVSERLLARLTGQTLEQIAGVDENDLPKEDLERERIIRARVNHWRLINTGAVSQVWRFLSYW